MRFLMYAKTNGTEELFYDSESGIPEMAIAQPNLKLELSKAGSLQFTILPTHPMYDSFSKMKTYIRVMRDEKEIFRGRVLEIEDTTYLERHISCEGDLSYLIDSLQPPQQEVQANSTTTTRTTNATYKQQYGDHVAAKYTDVQSLTLGNAVNTSNQLSAQFTKYITQHNSQMESEKQFTVGQITMTTTGSVSFSSNSYRDTKNAIDNDLIKQYGGYLQTRHNSNCATYIDWLKEPGSASQQSIVLGVNLIDLQQRQEGDEMFTIFVPIGDSDLTIASVNDGKIGIEDAAGIAKYGKIYKTQSYSGITDATELKKLGQDYMAANYKPDKLSLSIKAIDMNLLDGDIDAIEVGSTVTVVSEPHDIELSMTCISIEYDIQNPENNSYEIGDPSETLSQKTNSNKTAADSATKSASRSASRANSAASTLEDTVNRHAANITDQADAVYKLEADLVQVHAKCIKITATEKVTVTTDVLDVNASGEINMKAGGTFTIEAGGDMELKSRTKININDRLLLGDDGQLVDDYTFYNIGEAWMSNLTIGGLLEIAEIHDEDEGQWTTNSLSGFTSMYSASFIYTGGSSNQYVEDAVKSFGNGSVSSTGVVSIPYYTFSGDGQGNITFDMASTAFFTNSMEAARLEGWNLACDKVTRSNNTIYGPIKNNYGGSGSKYTAHYSASGHSHSDPWMKIDGISGTYWNDATVALTSFSGNVQFNNGYDSYSPSDFWWT